MDWQYLEDWIEVEYDNKRTIYQVRSWLKKFFRFVNVEPEEYIKSERNFDLDYKRYNNYLKKNMSHTSIGNRLSIVKEFLADHEIHLKHRTVKSIKRKAVREKTVADEKVPTREELKQILMNANGRDKAVFLTLLSSGLRPRELIHLRVKDFDLEHDPPLISVPFQFIDGEYTKTKTSKITFCTNEAKEALQAWLKIRPRALLESVFKSHFTRKMYKDMGYQFERKEVKNKKGKIEIKYIIYDEYDMVITKERFAEEIQFMFPFGYQTVRNMWVRLLKKSGYDDKEEKTHQDRYEMHAYTLKKYFTTKLKDVIQSYYVEAMLGHTTTYDKPSVETLSDAYLKGMRKLQIYEVAPNQDELDSLSSQINDLQKQMADMIKTTEYYKQSYVDDYGIPIKTIDGEPVNDNLIIDKYKKSQADMDYIKAHGLEAWRKKVKKLPQNP